MLRYMDRTLLKELKQREDRIAEAEKRSFATTSGQIAIMVLLLGVSYAVIHRDMARINRYKRQLEKTVGQLEKTVSENKVLIEARKRIMLTVTHDLRTPLTAIGGNIELLLTEENKAKREEYIRTIRQVTGRMASMLAGLLDFSGWKAIRKSRTRFLSGFKALPMHCKQNLCLWLSKRD